MALRSITLPTMAALTTHWRTTARPVFDDRPLLAGILPVLDELADELEILRRV